MLSLIPKFALWPFVRPVLSKGLTAIAVGAGGLIARTLDGTAWTEPNSTVTVNLFQAAFGSDTWMVVGASSTVLISKDDGATWSKLALPADITNNMAFGVASIVYDAGRFVIISNDSSMAYTPDLGVTWVRQAQTASIVAFRPGKAKRISLDGAIYQPGGGVGSFNGYAIFKWNGTNYTITSQQVTGAGGYTVQGSITETKDYLVTAQQGNTSWRRKATDTSWAITRGPNSSNALIAGGSATDPATDTVVQVGNFDQSASQPMILKGIAGANWTALDSTVLTTMFGTNQMLNDIGVAGTTSLIVGGSKIFYSTDFTAWSSVFTTSKTLNTITVRSRATISGDVQRWRHISFASNEAIDDVTEKFGVITGAPTFTANRMTSTSANTSVRLKDSAIIGANEDFTFQITITPKSALSGSNTGDTFIAGTTDGPSEIAGSFYVLYSKNLTKFVFYAKISGTFSGFTSDSITIPAGTDVHIEFSRKAGRFYAFINGVLQTLATVNAAALGAPQAANAKGLGLGSNSASYLFDGTRRGMYFDKGVCRHTESFVPDTTVQTYVRPLYSTDDAKAIRSQIGFRRDAIVDEANDRVIINTGGVNQVVQQGRMKFNGTQASNNGLTYFADPFGAGDFTIECAFNTSAVGATAGFLLLSEWWLGSATNDANRWALLIASDRKAYFQMNRSTVGTDAVSVYSTVALTLNTDYKVIVERVSGVLTLYVLDFYTGVQIDKISAPCTFPIRGAQPRIIRNYSQGTGNYSGTGWIWDVRIADKAMYNGAVGISATMPGFPDNKYTTAEEANIVTQATFARSPRDEKLGTLVAVDAAGGSIISGRISTAGAFTWGSVTPAFSAGDFTIESRFLVTSASGDPVSLFGQFLGTASNNAWQFRLIGGKIAVVFSPTGAPSAGLIVIASPDALVLNQEYYVVAERVGTTVTLYIDGVSKASGTFSGAMPVTTLPIQRGDSGSVGIALRDVRISKTSQYKGVVPTFPQYKRLNTVKPSLTMGFYSGGTGTIYGYLENASYNTENISLGSCTHKLFKFTSGGTTIVRRLKGMFIDRGSFLILGWEDTTLTPTADMLTWTNTLQINGVNFVNNGQLVSGFASPQGGNSIYWSGVSAMNPLQEGREIAFEFV